MNEFARHGFRTVVFNPRGVGIPQITSNIYDPSRSPEDLHFVLSILFKRYPKANFYLAGSSFGACISIRYITNYDHGNRIKGVVSMANPFDIYKSAQNINNPSNKIFGKYMSKNLLKKVKFNIEAVKKWQAETGIELQLNEMEKLENTFEFDEKFTFIVHPQYKVHKDYYDLISCIDFIDKIRIPVFFLHSKDDPICP